MTLAVNLAQGASNNVTFRNRIINGACVIDQRNAGASTTPTTSGTYTLDRWRVTLSVASKFSIQQSTTAPTGFNFSTLITSASAYSVGASEQFALTQFIEGYNTSDLMWGTSDAKTVTLSFWVRSSLTGTFGGVLKNNANDRSYPFTYTISSANTWEYETITIAGDTSGTWVGATNDIGLRVQFSLGTGSTLSTTAGAWASGNYSSATGAVSVVGTNGATFYITGVQLEAGTTASPFEYRQYGTELALCQRYYEKTYDQSVVPGTINESGPQFESNGATVTAGGGPIRFTVAKRSTPTVTSYSTSTGTSGKVHLRSQGVDVTPSIDLIGQTGTRVSYSQSSGIVNTSYHWVASAEL